MKIYIKEISDLIVKTKSKKIVLRGGGVLNDIDKADYNELCEENKNFKLWLDKELIVVGGVNSDKTDEVVGEKAEQENKRQKELEKSKNVKIKDA